MAKKSETSEKGKRGVAILLGGKPFTLRFKHSIIGDFEVAANDLLWKMGAIQEKTIIFADQLIPGQLMNHSVLALALLYGLQADHKAEDLNMQKITDMIDLFVEDKGDLKILRRKVAEAFKLATDPSSVSSLLESWKSLDEDQELEERKIQALRNLDILKKRPQIEGAERIIEKLKKDLSGSVSQESASLNSEVPSSKT